MSLLRELWDVLCPGDVLLTDGLLSTWTEMALLKQRGVDCVSRLNKATRSADFRRGRSLGKGDHIVRWPKPSRKPVSFDRETFKALQRGLLTSGGVVDPRHGHGIPKGTGPSFRLVSLQVKEPAWPKIGADPDHLDSRLAGVQERGVWLVFSLAQIFISKTDCKAKIRA